MEPDCPLYTKTYRYFINDVETAQANLPAWLSLDQNQESVTFFTTDTSLIGQTLRFKVEQNLNKKPIPDWTTQQTIDIEVQAEQCDGVQITSPWADL